MASQKVLLFLLIQSSLSQRQEPHSLRLSNAKPVLTISTEYKCSKRQFTGTAGLTTASFEDCISLCHVTSTSSASCCATWEKSTNQCHLFKQSSVFSNKTFRSKRTQQDMLTNCTRRKNYQPKYALTDDQFLRYSMKLEPDFHYLPLVRTDNQCLQQGLYHYHQPTAALQLGVSTHFAQFQQTELSFLGVTQKQCQKICKLTLGCNHWNFARFRNKHTGDCLLMSEELENCRSCTRKCPLRTHCANGSN